MVDSRTNYAKDITTLLIENYGSKVKIFENQQKKAAGGKIGFAILYTTNQVVAADYTDPDPVSGIYNHKYIDFAKFLPENDL